MANIIPEHNLIFIHVPKTGGTSISNWISKNFDSKYYRKHCTLETAQVHWQLNHYKSFCVMRDPYDWLVSWYEYEKIWVKDRILQVQNGNIKRYKINKDKDNIDVLEEKLNVLDQGFEKYAINSNKDLQSKWTTGVDIILRFDNLENDFQLIQKSTNCYIPLEHANSSSRKTAESYYTKKLKKHVRKKYYQDFKVYENVFNTRL